MLTAPAHLRGRMTRHSPASLRAERLGWIAARYNEGCRQTDIAAALGITQSTLSTTIENHGICRRRAPLLAKRINHTGLRLGRLTDMFDTLPPETREELADEAARMRGTIADAIAKRLTADFPKSGGASG